MQRLPSTRYIDAFGALSSSDLKLGEVLLKPVFHQGYQVFSSGFFQDVFAVGFHRSHANLELLTNFFAGEFVEDEAEDFGFPGGQVWHGKLSL